MLSLSDFINLVPASYQWPVQFCAVVSVALWLLSLITSNVSQVDRVWTFLPTIYTAYYALLPIWPQKPIFFLCPYTPKSLGWVVARDYSPRAVLMFSLVVIWMFRLSYNTYRRGLFKPADEDYRWAVLRAKLPPWLFQIFNLIFIAGIQNILLLSLGLPTRIAATIQPHSTLATSDLVLAALALLDLAVEFTADNQQWAYHQYKHAFLAKEKGNADVQPYDKRRQWPGARLGFTPEDAKRGFITNGLWGYSRHPNFFCEQSFWWIITLMPLFSPYPPNFTYTSFPVHLIPSMDALMHHFPHALYPLAKELAAPLADVAPALALSALFFSSTLFTESISESKYPRQYAAYKKRVGMFSPLSTWEKGLWLTWKGTKAEVEEAVWGTANAEKGKVE